MKTPVPYNYTQYLYPNYNVVNVTEERKYPDTYLAILEGINGKRKEKSIIIANVFSRPAFFEDPLIVSKTLRKSKVENSAKVDVKKEHTKIFHKKLKDEIGYHIEAPFRGHVAYSESDWLYSRENDYYLKRAFIWGIDKNKEEE